MFLALVSLWDRPPPPPTTTLIREAEGANERERDPFCTLPFVTSEIRCTRPRLSNTFSACLFTPDPLPYHTAVSPNLRPSLHSHSLGDSRLWQNWTKSSIDSPNGRAEKGAVAAAGSLLFHRPLAGRSKQIIKCALTFRAEGASRTIKHSRN